jgi:hypothetical protein
LQNLANVGKFGLIQATLDKFKHVVNVGRF